MQPQVNINEWINWLSENPPPDLQELVRAWGTYRNIPADAWAEYADACTQWENQRMARLLGPNWKIQGRQQKGPTKPQGKRPMR